MDGKQGRKGDTGPPGQRGDAGNRGPRGIIGMYLNTYITITALTHLVYGYRNHGLRDRIMGGADYKTDVREDQDGVRIFTVWDHF